MSTEENTNWTEKITSILTSWGVPAALASIITGAILGGIAAYFALFTTSCSLITESEGEITFCTESTCITLSQGSSPSLLFTQNQSSEEEVEAEEEVSSESSTVILIESEGK